MKTKLIKLVRGRLYEILQYRLEIFSFILVAVDRHCYGGVWASYPWLGVVAVDQFLYPSWRQDKPQRLSSSKGPEVCSWIYTWNIYSNPNIFSIKRHVVDFSCSNMVPIGIAKISTGRIWIAVAVCMDGACNVWSYSLLWEATQPTAGLEIPYATVWNRVHRHRITAGCTGILAIDSAHFCSSHQLQELLTAPLVSTPPLNSPQWVQLGSWILLKTHLVNIYL